MARKSFFKDRTLEEIKELRVSMVYKARGLVHKIDGLNLGEEALEIRTLIVPAEFFINVQTGARASRKAYKHGDLIPINHPVTKAGCDVSSEIPLAMRAKDFALLEKLKEEENYFVGYYFQPRWGGDNLKRVVPFLWLPEAMKIFAYGETRTKGFEIEPYADSEKVASEGASVVVQVPSRTKKQSRYKIKLVNVPMKRSNENLSQVLALRTSVLPDAQTGETGKSRPLHDVYNIRYTWAGERERSPVIMFYPHDIAAYIAIAGSEWRDAHNLTPMEMNPFALPSAHQKEFYKKLCNNVLIYDPTLRSKDKLRKLHIVEKSILLARAIGKFGHDDFAFWAPERDGKLKDYDWSVP